MAKLIIQNSQVVGFDDSITVIENTTIIDAIMRHFPEGIDSQSLRLFINKRELNIEKDDLTQQLSDSDTLFVLLESKSIETLIVVAIIASIAVTSLIPEPKIPNLQGESKSSPNNQFSGQTNIARTYEAWPLILGKIVSYPDLIGEPIYEYVNNTQQLRQFFSIGFGSISVSDVRVGESGIGNFTGATSQVFLPTNNNATIQDYLVGFSAREVEGQILKGVNSSQESEQYDLTVSNNGSLLLSGFLSASLVKDAESTKLFNDFNASTDDFTMRIGFEYTSVEAGGSGTSTDNGILSSMTDNGSYYTMTINPFSFSSGEVESSLVSIFFAAKISSSSVNSINMANEIEELRINLAFPRGLKSNVAVQVVVEQLTSKGGAATGFSFTGNYNFNEDTLDPIYKTIKIKDDLNGLGWYRFSVKRNNAESNDASLPDETRLERVQGVRYYQNKTFGDITLLEVNLSSSGGVPTTNNTKINCDAVALTPTNNNSTLLQSRKFADAVLHTYVNYYGLSESKLNLDSLYAIQNEIDANNEQLGYFDFSFDDGDITLQQRLETICNAARVSVFLTNGQWQFVREEKRPFPVGLITGRDISGENREYSITGGGSNPSDFDGIRLEYIDPATNKKAYIRKTIANGQIIDGDSFNPKTMSLSGCRNEAQARNRAELEIRKLAYQVESLTETVTQSASIFDKGDMVLYAEQYEQIVMDGEILDVNGNVITTSELLQFESGKTYTLYHTLIDGSVSSAKAITPLQISSSYNVIINDTSGIFLRDGTLGYNIQTGSRYIIVADSEFENTQWTLTEKTSSDGRATQITMVNYDERVFDYD